MCSSLSFRILNSSAGIPSPPLALFTMMLPKARLTSHSRMSGSRSIPLLSFIVPALKDELPRWAGVQYAPGEEHRNGSRRSEEAEPKWKQHPVVNVTGGESEV